MQLGGNKALFDFMKEYEIHELDNAQRYKHKALIWYKKYHISKAEGREFTVPKPPKDWNERMEMTKSTLKNVGESISSGASSTLNEIKSVNYKQHASNAYEKSKEFAAVADEKAKQLAGKIKE
jgi:hypothetical protein